jgi:glycosyltransferase involved in cell wall biosynthesis
MIYLNVALGHAHGWGVCGKNIARQLARLEPVRLLSEPFDASTVGDLLEFHELNALLLTDRARGVLTTAEGAQVADGPLLQGIANEALTPRRPQIRGKPTIGYTFFERNLMQPAWIDNGRRHFDRVVAGSTWCARTLAEHGLSGVSTAIQGIDPEVFSPSCPEDGRRQFLADKFVVFSGGKFELRKGQDLVIRAYKALQDRHWDVMLVNLWFNAWPPVMDTMQASRLIRFTPSRGSYVQVMNGILADNGIAVERVITCPRESNVSLARLYRNTDVGVFPNRCEGGTNLVLMEYMACGRPVIAVDTTGHADIVTPANALIVATRGEITVKDSNGVPVARWPEPDLDDLIDKLEWAYQHRGKLRELGRQAGQDLANRTWRKTAETLRGIIHEVAGVAEEASATPPVTEGHPADQMPGEHGCAKSAGEPGHPWASGGGLPPNDPKPQPPGTGQPERPRDAAGLSEAPRGPSSRVNAVSAGETARDSPRTETIIIGCHHKTGTNILTTLLNVISARHWLPERVARGRSDDRKLPLSRILESYPEPPSCYVGIWFEHEVDVPADSVRFLHFVRHPAKWVRSAYLYHRKGGPLECTAWLKWRVFRNGGRHISYHELLNEMAVEQGLLIEAVRCYPEVAGTARAASTSSHLLTRVQTSLEKFHTDFDSSVRSVCGFMGLDSGGSDEIADAMSRHDLSIRRPDELPSNVTRNSPEAARLERYLVEDPAFHRLYAQPAVQMGFALDSSSVRSESLLDDSVVEQILEAKPFCSHTPSCRKPRSSFRGTRREAVGLPARSKASDREVIS